MAIVNKFNVNKQQVTLDADIIENMSANDVSYNSSLQYDENTVGDKLSKLGSEVIYDVTTNNDGATFSSLSALLSSKNLSTLIPTSVRYGGMAIRFVQSSDNKYIQARCMAQNFTTDVSKWQGVDDKPTAESQNLITSGAVEKILKSDNLTNVLLGKCNLVEIKNAYINGVGTIVNHLTSKSVFFDITGINKIIVYVNDSEINDHYCAFYDDNYNLVLNNQPLNSNDFTILDVPTGSTRFGALVILSEMVIYIVLVALILILELSEEMFIKIKKIY